MKILNQSLLLFAFVVTFGSCEKVIDVKLNNVAKKYVIEGVVADQPGSWKVKISQTKDFNENNEFPGVSGATVTVSDNDVPVKLEETVEGVYSAPDKVAVSGHLYKLEVRIDDQVFQASSRLPKKIGLDSLYVNQEKIFGKGRLIPYVEYVDPAETGDSYRFILYRNDEPEKDIFVVNDDYSNDRRNSWQLLTFDDDDDDDDEEDEDKIKPGDRIAVDMFCLDNAVYRYWYSMSAATGGGNGSTPANPVTNISGGALGYFSAQTEERREVVAP
jgi:hypothetical protein